MEAQPREEPKAWSPAAFDRALASAIPGWFPAPYGWTETRRLYGAQGVKIIPNPHPKPDAVPDEDYDRYVLYPRNWEAQHLITVDFPIVGKLHVHRLVVPILKGTLEAWGKEAEEHGIKYPLHAGSFNVRYKKTKTDEISGHALGIALDMNADTNPLQAKADDALVYDLPHALIDAFTSRGWKWGGTFKGRKDPMHFQYFDGA